jgi:hypothetical protein
MKETKVTKVGWGTISNLKVSAQRKGANLRHTALPGSGTHSCGAADGTMTGEGGGGYGGMRSGGGKASGVFDQRTPEHDKAPGHSGAGGTADEDTPF